MAIKGVYELYLNALVPLSPRSELVPLLKAVINCGETTKDFVWALRNDVELQGWLRHAVAAMGFETKTQGLEQVITLIGQDKVRDILLGRSIEAAFTPREETLMVKHSQGKSKPASTDGEDSEFAGEAPPVADFANYLTFAKRAESVANAIRDSYPWQAFVGGLLYDYLAAYVKAAKIDANDAITRADIKASKTYVETQFLEGLRSAVAALEVLQKISIKHHKNVFIASLLHSCGRLVQLGFDPVAYQSLLEQVDLKRSLQVTVSLLGEEKKFFVFDHAQMTSLYLGRLPFMLEIDRVLDYSGSPKLLRMRDANLYALHCVVKIGSELAKLYQKERSSQSDILKMKDEHVRALEEYSFLKLNADEWKSVKSNFALKIMRASL